MAATPKPNPSMDAMVIDAIDHIALCIADSVNDLPDEEREKQRNEIVKTFADGLLLKAKAAENRHKQTAKDSLNMFMAYVKPSRDERKAANQVSDVESIPEKIPELKQEPVTEEDHIKRFRELRAKFEEEACEHADESLRSGL
jgi:hypothetical protein